MQAEAECLAHVAELGNVEPAFPSLDLADDRLVDAEALRELDLRDASFLANAPKERNENRILAVVKWSLQHARIVEASLE